MRRTSVRSIRARMLAGVAMVLAFLFVPAVSGAHFVANHDSKGDTTTSGRLDFDVQYGAFIHCHRYDRSLGNPCVEGGRDRALGIETFTYGSWKSRKLRDRNFFQSLLDTRGDVQQDRLIRVSWKHGRLTARIYDNTLAGDLLAVVPARRNGNHKAVSFVFKRKFLGPVRPSGRIGWNVWTFHRTSNGGWQSEDEAPDDAGYFSHVIRS